VTRGGSSIEPVRRLLAVLGSGRWCAEIGTAFGEGAAALAETAAHVVTVEIDPERAALALRRLVEATNVELLVGDWHDELVGRGPFGLIFFDGGPLDDLDTVVSLLEPGGFLVKDDLTPPERSALFGNPRLVAAEIQVAAERAALVAVRR